MIPTLPGQDPDPIARRAQLTRARETWRFLKRYSMGTFPGIALAAEVPVSDRFSPNYGLEVSRVGGAALLNQMLLSLSGRYSGDLRKPSPQDWLDVARARHRPESGLVAPNRAAQGAVSWEPLVPANSLPRPIPQASNSNLEFPIDVSEYSALYASIQEPELVRKFARPGEFQDRAFAWQRLAGANPMVLTRVGPDRATASVPPALDEASYRRAVGEPDSLAKALGEGRLYVADYRLLADLPEGRPSNGRKKYGCAPRAWFASLPPTRQRPSRFLPIAIECQPPQQKPRLFLPWDGVRWMMARTAVQMADGNLQEMVYHLGRTHLVMEGVVLAARRSLAANHPLLVLLEPHFEFTLAINDYASRHLIAPNGDVDKLLSSTLEGSLTLTARSFETLDMKLLAPPRDLSHRGVDDRDALPEYPYRDDALLVWGAIRRFVERYVRVYYASDQAVVADAELANFVRVLSDADQAGLRGVPPLDGIQALSEFLATVIFTASAQHSALNYAQFPMMGFAPNMPAALYAPPPTDSTPDDLSSWLAMLPSTGLALPQFTLLYQLSNVRWGRLGHYSPLQFLDCRVWQALLRFRWDLERVEAQILAADADRFLSYPFLLPSQLGCSIYI